MVTYTFECEDELWDDWTDSFPRSQNIDDRLRQLMREDLER